MNLNKPIFKIKVPVSGMSRTRLNEECDNIRKTYSDLQLIILPQIFHKKTNTDIEVLWYGNELENLKMKSYSSFQKHHNIKSIVEELFRIIELKSDNISKKDLRYLKVEVLNSVLG